MGSLSIWHWLIILLAIVLLFGSGKIKNLFGEFGKGITAFKKGLKEGDDDVKADTAAASTASTASPQVSSTPATVAAGEVKKDAKV